MPAGRLVSRLGDNRFETECATFFSEVVQVFGVPKSIGQIYGLLYASPEPLSFSDIVVRLKISKGSASQGLQLLRSLGAINVAGAKRKEKSDRLRALSDRREVGEHDVLNLTVNANHSHSHLHSDSHLHPHLGGDAPRRVAFEPELSLRKLVSGVMQERVTPFATAGADRLGRLRKLAKASGEAGDFYQDRVEQLEIWRRRLAAVMPVLTVLLGPKNRK